MTWIIGSKRACLLCCSCLIAIASCAGSGQRVTVRVIDGKPQPTRYVSPGAYEHYLRAELARRDGHAAMAAEELEKALTFDPYAPLLHTRLAATYAQLDRHTQAYEHLHRALELKRDFPDALMVRGDLYAKDEKAVPARLSYERCLSVDPHNVGCHLRLAAWHDRNGDTAGARRLLRHLIERTQGEHGRRQLVQLCLRDLDLGCAAKQLEAARLADPRPATLW